MLVLFYYFFSTVSFNSCVSDARNSNFSIIEIHLKVVSTAFKYQVK